ncbi:MAG: hypothetical protein ACP5OA_05515 [Candidatus Woesearchaeota archaeon]
MSEYFKGALIILFILCITPIVLADDSINFTAQTDNSALINRNNILIDVIASSKSLMNITIWLYDYNGTLYGSAGTNTNRLIVNFTDLLDGKYYFNATAIYMDTITSTETRSITIKTTNSMITSPNIINENDTNSINKSNKKQSEIHELAITNQTYTSVSDEEFEKNASKSYTINTSKANNRITELEISKHTQLLTIIIIVGAMMLIIGIVSGVLIYKNLTKPKAEETHIKEDLHETPPIKEKIKSVLISYEEEPVSNIKPVIIEKNIIRHQEIKPLTNPEMYIKKINQLILQCEYALDNGKLNDAKNHYNNAREIYLHSNLNYEQKFKVYNKIIELSNKFNKQNIK